MAHLSVRFKENVHSSDIFKKVKGE
jgi:hypothetical protein